MMPKEVKVDKWEGLTNLYSICLCTSSSFGHKPPCITMMEHHNYKHISPRQLASATENCLASLENPQIYPSGRLAYFSHQCMMII